MKKTIIFLGVFLAMFGCANKNDVDTIYNKQARLGWVDKDGMAGSKTVNLETSSERAYRSNTTIKIPANIQGELNLVVKLQNTQLDHQDFSKLRVRFIPDEDSKLLLDASISKPWGKSALESRESASSIRVGIDSFTDLDKYFKAGKKLKIQVVVLSAQENGTPLTIELPLEVIE